MTTKAVALPSFALGAAVGGMVGAIAGTIFAAPLAKVVP